MIDILKYSTSTCTIMCMHLIFVLFSIDCVVILDSLSKLVAHDSLLCVQVTTSWEIATFGRKERPTSGSILLSLQRTF